VLGRSVPESPVAVIASGRDTVACRLARAIERRGREALLVDGPAAARLFTIRRSGRECSVTPALPMFIRHSAWWSDVPRVTSDERFSIGESYSAIWAVAALSAAPVINRPDWAGWRSHLTAGDIGSLLPPDQDQGLAEVFASGPRQATMDYSGPIIGTLWGKNVDRQTGPVSSLPAGVPLRARPVDQDAGYEIITVVGDRAFSATDDPRSSAFALRDRSVQLARQGGVHFAAVTWSVGADAVPVRLSANADESEVRYAWREVEDALCTDLIA
jgi:hypothetical protein